MTHDEAKKRIAEINALRKACDDSAALTKEDELYLDFVFDVASLEGPHQAVAREILKTFEKPTR